MSLSARTSSTPSLTPSRSPSPEAPVQPDHFYGNDNVYFSPNGKSYLDPSDDPLAQRGIPVFKPTMEDFEDFEAYMTKIECWGMRSGIVKVIPPKEWTDSLPSVVPQLRNVKMKNPIEQRMVGHGGLFRQQNIERRKVLSVREWAEMCGLEEMRAPGKDETDLRSNAPTQRKPRRASAKKAKVSAEEQRAQSEVVVVKEEPEVEDSVHVGMDIDEGSKLPDESPHASSSHHIEAPPLGESSNDQARVPNADEEQGEGDPSPRHSVEVDETATKRNAKGRSGATKEERDAREAERAAKDVEWLESFNPLEDWLPPKTSNSDYNPEFCKELERRYWRNCGLGRPPWYGADMQGSLFTGETTSWNVAHLPSTLTRLLPTASKGLPGVNTPYLYFGMWRATFAWHVEDMDLFSINYIHFGAPKFWYAMPQARSAALEQTMKGYFPRDIIQCPQFLRHKSFLASPTVLGRSSCRPNFLVQRQGEFVITYPRGYHAGFNLGFNCAESVNFALDSWLDLGRKAKVCECVNFSVRIDVDRLLEEREAERAELSAKAKAKQTSSRKRKADPSDAEPTTKKLKIRISKPASKESTAPAQSANSEPIVAPPAKPKLVLKLSPPQPKDADTFPCCLCVSTRREGLLRVVNPPLGRKEGGSGPTRADVWMAHEECANVVPETWADEIDNGTDLQSGVPLKERVVFGVDAIVKDRWNLKCSACTKTKHKAHGAPIQCTKGRCPKAFHVSCARDGTANGVVYEIVRDVEKEVVLLDALPTAPGADRDGVMASEQHPLPGQSEGTEMSGGQVEDPNGPNQNVVKVVKKIEVCVLCSQHNPAIADAKKAQKQERIKNELVALPPMARIKLRVSAGVFEVSLVRVLEESGCVEVLWDRGIKREFKWGSVVFGKTEEVVGHKPTEPAATTEFARLAPAVAVPQGQDGSSSSNVNGHHHPNSFPPLHASAPTVEVRQAHPVSYHPSAPVVAHPPPAGLPGSAAAPPGPQNGAGTVPHQQGYQGPAYYHPLPLGHHTAIPPHVSPYQQPYGSAYQYASWTYQYTGAPGNPYGAHAAYQPPIAHYTAVPVPGTGASAVTGGASQPAHSALPPPPAVPPLQVQGQVGEGSMGSTSMGMGMGMGMGGGSRMKQLQVHQHPTSVLPHHPPQQARPPSMPRQLSRGLQWQRPYTGPKETENKHTGRAE